MYWCSGGHCCACCKLHVCRCVRHFICRATRRHSGVWAAECTDSSAKSMTTPFRHQVCCGRHHHCLPTIATRRWDHCCRCCIRCYSQGLRYLCVRVLVVAAAAAAAAAAAVAAGCKCVKMCCVRRLWGVLLLARVSVLLMVVLLLVVLLVVVRVAAYC